MPTKNPNSKKKVTCLDCNHEFELDTEGQGECPECNLDMGALLNRDRHERALQKLREAREREQPKKKRSDPLGWS